MQVSLSASGEMNAKRTVEVEAHDLLQGYPLLKISNIGYFHTERRKVYLDFLGSLAHTITQLEADYKSTKEIEKTLQVHKVAIMEGMQESLKLSQQKIKSLKEIHASFKKECDNMDNEYRAQTDRLANEYEDHNERLRQKLISICNRNEWETLQEIIFKVL